jgi:hypothetical protein
MRVYLLLTFTLLLTASKAKAGDLSGNPVGCRAANSKLQYFYLNGKVLLNQNFLPASAVELKKLKEEAVEIQLKHLMSFFRTTSLNMNAVLASYRSEPKILNTELVKYASSFPVDDYLPSSRGPAMSAYIKRALTRGHVDQSDHALLIHYQSKILIADCSPNGLVPSQILLPRDPYLSLWIEDKVKRKPRSFGPYKLDHVSNCSSREIVLFGNYDVNWYFWSPVSNGKGECQRDDNKMYSPKIAAVNEVEKIEPIHKTFFKSQSLKVAAIFGIVDQSELFVKNDFLFIKKSVADAFNHCKKLNSVPACLTQWSDLTKAQSNKKYYEPGAFHFFNYLKYLNTLVRIDKVSVTDVDVNSNEVYLKVSGKLIDSNTPIELVSYYGKTTLDYGPRVSKLYLKLLRDSFQEFDSISYVGHAGLGQNLNMRTLNKFWGEDKLTQVSRTKPLWLGIYNCEAFSYFGFDLDTIFKPGFKNVVLTETIGTDSGSKFPLSQLSLINNLYSNHAQDSSRDIQKVMGRYVSGRDFLTSLRFME